MPATIVAEPTSPPDAEQITTVHGLPPEQAIGFLEQHDDLDHADVVRLAVLTGIFVTTGGETWQSEPT